VCFLSEGEEEWKGRDGTATKKREREKHAELNRTKRKSRKTQGQIFLPWGPKARSLFAFDAEAKEGE
jgi:hypothetical protein